MKRVRGTFRIWRLNRIRAQLLTCARTAIHLTSFASPFFLGVIPSFHFFVNGFSKSQKKINKSKTRTAFYESQNWAVLCKYCATKWLYLAEIHFYWSIKGAKKETTIKRKTWNVINSRHTNIYDFSGNRFQSTVHELIFFCFSLADNLWILSRCQNLNYKLD